MWAFFVMSVGKNCCQKLTSLHISKIIQTSMAPTLNLSSNGRFKRSPYLRGLGVKWAPECPILSLYYESLIIGFEYCQHSPEPGIQALGPKNSKILLRKQP